MPVYALPQLDLSCPLLQQNKQVVSMAPPGAGRNMGKRNLTHFTHGLESSESWGSTYRHLDLNGQSCATCLHLFLAWGSPEPAELGDFPKSSCVVGPRFTET